MYLVEILHRTMRISYTGESAEVLVNELAVAEDAQELDDQAFLGYNLEAGLGPLLRLQLDQKRAAEKEAKRIARERALLEEFDHNEDQLMKLMQQMVTAVGARSKRKCTLEYLKGAVAETKNLLLNIQGLNVAHAGRRCQQ
jgi:hypothetical protein